MLMRRAQEDGRPRFSVADLRAHLMPLLTNLFGALRKPESEENEYLMKAVTRVITFVGPEVWALCLQKCSMALLGCHVPQNADLLYLHMSALIASAPPLCAH